MSKPVRPPRDASNRHDRHGRVVFCACDVVGLLPLQDEPCEGDRQSAACLQARKEIAGDGRLVAPGGLIPPTGGGPVVPPVYIAHLLPRFTADRGRIFHDPDRVWPKISRWRRLRWRLAARTWRIRAAFNILVHGAEDHWDDE